MLETLELILFIIVHAAACFGFVYFLISAIRLGLVEEKSKEERDEFLRLCAICALCLFIIA